MIARETDWRPAFIAHLRDSANVRRSVEAAGIARSTAYLERERNAEFAAAWDVAIEDAVDLIEEEMDRRGRRGVLKDVWYKGEVVGQELEYSDALLQTLARAHRPDRFGQRIDARHSGPDGGPIQIQQTPPDLSGLDDAELDQYHALLKKLETPHAGGDRAGDRAEEVCEGSGLLAGQLRMDV